MAVSPFSASFRAAPGYAARPTVASAPMPVFTLPGIPSVPAIDDARAPNAVGRSWLSTRLGGLEGKYGPMLTGAQLGAKQALAGYGGWTWHADDPSTPQREDLQAPDYDPNAPLGAKQKQAVGQERNASNARGMLYSSFTNQNIGSALTRLNEEARAIINQYAGQINQILGAQSSEATDIVTDWTRLYGEDSRWLVENPPPTPPPPPPPPDPNAGLAMSARGEGIVWKGSGPPNLDALRARHPGRELVVRRTGAGGYVVTVV